MDSIAIRFPLGQHKASHISQWISCAVTKGVEKIDLDLSDEWGSCEVDNASSTASEQYTSPCWLLASPGKACRVKHLQLTSCSISLLSISNSSLASQLVTVDLRGVNISDEQLEGLLSTCLSLERMVLHCCDDLVNFKLTNPISSRMKLLTIQNCSRIKNIELYAENLEMLEYTGHLAHFSFKNVPKLAQVFLSFTGNSRLDGVTYALYRIAYDLPQLKTLNLTSILAITVSGIIKSKKILGFRNHMLCPYLVNSQTFFNLTITILVHVHDMLDPQLN